MAVVVLAPVSFQLSEVVELFNAVRFSPKLSFLAHRKQAILELIESLEKKHGNKAKAFMLETESLQQAQKRKEQQEHPESSVLRKILDDVYAFLAYLMLNKMYEDSFSTFIREVHKYITRAVEKKIIDVDKAKDLSNQAEKLVRDLKQKVPGLI